MHARAFAWILLLMLTSCARSGDEPEQATALIARLDVELPAVVARGNSPAMQVAVVLGDRVLWSRGFGGDERGDAVYMIASVQKSLTAAAALQLAERGRLDLDADVGEVLPFPVRHPAHPETPVTARMLLAHRSGLAEFPHQFAWDTESAFAPRYRPSCPDSLAGLSLEDFLRASLLPGGANHDAGAWRFAPGDGYRYSVSAYPLLRDLIGRADGRGYETCLRESLFAPLGMSSSGFAVAEFADRHAPPFTRIDGENVALPLWSGRAALMRSSAEDMARFTIAMMNEGRYGDRQILRPESVALMLDRTSRFKTLFRRSDDLRCRGHGLGHFAFRGGWYGNGGSVPGFQCLARYHPRRRVGYVILSNVNAILGGGHNYASARAEVYAVQDALLSILDPGYRLRSRLGEIGIVAGLGLYSLLLFAWSRRRRRRARGET